MFSDDAKIACTSLLNKHTDDKYSVANFWPVIVVNTFSKIYENIVKYFLTSKMEHHFSHVLFRLLGGWRNKLDNNVLGSVLTELSKAFDCIPHNLLVAQLNAYGFNRDTVA